MRVRVRLRFRWTDKGKGKGELEVRVRVRVRVQKVQMAGWVMFPLLVETQQWRERPHQKGFIWMMKIA